MFSAKSGFGWVLVVAAWVGAGCGTSRDFSGGLGDAGSGGGAGTPTSAGTSPVAGTSFTDGGMSATDGGGSSTNGGAEDGGEASFGGDTAHGQAGDVGNDAGASQGGQGPQECPAFSCCISGKTFDANAISPLNACDVCKPAQSTSAWTTADGKVCESEQALAVHPKVAIYRHENCSLFCNPSVIPLAEKVTLSLSFGGTSQNRTSSESFLELDFSNLIPADTLSVSHALLRLYAEPDAPTAEQRWITIKRTSTADNICKVVLPVDASRVLVECDVTAAVQSWLASAAASTRSIKVSVSAPADRTASVLTPLAADGTQRPVLLLDYSGKCAADVCPKLVGN